MFGVIKVSKFLKSSNVVPIKSVVAAQVNSQSSIVFGNLNRTDFLLRSLIPFKILSQSTESAIILSLLRELLNLKFLGSVPGQSFSITTR